MSDFSWKDVDLLRGEATRRGFTALDDEQIGFAAPIDRAKQDALNNLADRIEKGLAMSFNKLVSAIRTALEGETVTVRLHEDPPSAVFHATISGDEYVIIAVPTKAATLRDEMEDGPE